MASIKTLMNNSGKAGANADIRDIELEHLPETVKACGKRKPYSVSLPFIKLKKVSTRRSDE